MGLVIKGKTWVGGSREGVAGLIFRGIYSVLCKTAVPNLFDTDFRKTIFSSIAAGERDGFGMICALRVSCTLCLSGH